MVETASEEETQMAAEMAAMFLKEDLADDVYGSPKAGNGMSASVIRLINPISGKTVYDVQLDQNIAAYWFVRPGQRCRGGQGGGAWAGH